MDILLDKEGVFEKVSMNASIIARDAKDTNGVSLYDKIRILDRDNDILQLFWNRAISVILVELKDFVLESNNAQIVMMPFIRNNEAIITDLQETIDNYLINRITGEWLKLKAVEFAALYMDESNAILDVIKEKMYYKKEPQYYEYRTSIK